MTLETRLRRLEDKAEPNTHANNAHIHEGAAIENPREHCPQCRAMTDEEYAKWCEPRKDGRVHVVVVIRHEHGDESKET